MRKDRVACFHFDKNGVGVALFTTETMRLQCSRINSLCHLANPQLADLANTCTTVLTNYPLHTIFQSINIEHTAIIASVDKPMEQEITEHHLLKLTAHVNSLKNPKAYFKKMAENKLKFAALGVLLNHLLSQPRELKLYLEDLDYFTDTLFQLVSCGEGEVNFLEVARQDIHPSMIKGKGHSKQGYSILSAYEVYLFSTASKRILRYLILNPTYRKETLEQRYTLIDWMCHHLRDQQYAKHFRNLHVLEGVLKKFCRMSAEEEDWKKLLKTLEAMTDMAALLRLPDSPPLIRSYVQDPHWPELGELLSVFKQTFQFTPLRVRGGIDLTLDQLKQTYDSMPHLLTLIAKDQQWDIDFRIVFLAQVGYLIEIPPETQLPSEFDDWELQFSNGTNRYYSNQLTQALDREYGDTYGEIQDIEKKIIFDMEALVVQRQQVIIGLYWKLCQIQCFWGVSQMSRSMARPSLSSEALILAHAWHPLLSGENIIRNHSFSFPQSQAPKERVMNSQRNLVNMSYSNRCVIITGPNASGKTVYMKQLALSVYLAHVGFFVPATLAQIPLVDSIIFVGKTHSIYNQQSCGFHSQLASLSSLTQPYVLSNKSLILIDQLGSQIDYQNSLKLMYATVEYLTGKVQFSRNRLLSKQGDEFVTPLVVIVTHLSEILNSRIIEENYHVRFLTMMVEEEGISLFKIKPGLVAKGYGIRAAQHILPADFIELSKKYLEMLTE